ncbi:hypothetical protein [Candidatus Ichthyocystis sparus]|uniref:hypothetical protein n=1 Tax=Candidatus Ichthyocystis sparus TaxID=1561004 RepID=UPI000B804DD7|nr:hypothetical protein [Candidatus Ichthyocystis sparus]
MSNIESSSYGYSSDTYTCEIESPPDGVNLAMEVCHVEGIDPDVEALHIVSTVTNMEDDCNTTGMFQHCSWAVLDHVMLLAKAMVMLRGYHFKEYTKMREQVLSLMNSISLISVGNQVPDIPLAFRNQHIRNVSMAYSVSALLLENMSSEVDNVLSIESALRRLLKSILPNENADNTSTAGNVCLFLEEFRSSIRKVLSSLNTFMPVVCSAETQTCNASYSNSPAHNSSDVGTQTNSTSDVETQTYNSSDIVTQTHRYSSIGTQTDTNLTYSSASASASRACNVAKTATNDKSNNYSEEKLSSDKRMSYRMASVLSRLQGFYSGKYK